MSWLWYMLGRGWKCFEVEDLAMSGHLTKPGPWTLSQEATPLHRATIDKRVWAIATLPNGRAMLCFAINLQVLRKLTTTTTTTLVWHRH